MKKWNQTMKKVGALVLTLAMVVTMVTFPTKAEAAGEKTGTMLYLEPSDAWKADNARFAMYCYEGNSNIWVSMLDDDGDGIYEGELPDGYSNVIFCRMNPEYTDGPAWDKWEKDELKEDRVWNQTFDLTYDGSNNCYTVIHEKVYLNVSNSGWVQNNERYAMYVYNDTGNQWASMTKSADGVYEGEIPEGDWTHVIFCRMNGTTVDNNWDNRWDQTGNNVLDGDYYKVNDGSWKSSSGEWSHKHVDSNGVCDVCHKCSNDNCNDTFGDGYCDRCKRIMDGIGAKLAGYTLSLAGNIGVNFYMELAEDVANNNDAYAQITYPGGEKKVTVEKAVKNTTTTSGKTYHVFSCEVAAKDMTGDITLTMNANGKQGKTYTYTVKEYADYIINHPNDYNDNVEAFAKALLNYGAYSQQYFDPEVDSAKLANKDLQNKDVSSVTKDTFSSYASRVLEKDAGTFTSANLSLMSETMVNVLFKAAEGVDVSRLNFEVKIGDTAVDAPVEIQRFEDGYCRITVKDIKASDLDELYTFTVTSEDGTRISKLKYGAFSYAYTVMSLGEGEKDSLKNVTRALWFLNQAANELE